ncbi:C40 family peptidase [Cryobacterium roopkundense]|uniref:C40 family peptidase n=1 Tax=Cryobacterium roopkundense TaxID=1001240 RepID=UPI0014703606|nr:C40 family peptidase [Cryobacterium roopkundense]
MRDDNDHVRRLEPHRPDPVDAAANRRHPVAREDRGICCIGRCLRRDPGLEPRHHWHLGLRGAALAGTSTATGTDVATAAQKYLGVPYVFGGEDASGMDCSGLVQKVYADVGIEVPRLVSGQMKLGTEVGSLAEAQPGDLIVTGGGAHILIYAGNNKVIHAPYAGRTVCLVEAYMTDADIDTIRRVIPTQTAATAGNTTADMFSAALASFESGGAR